MAAKRSIRIEMSGATNGTRVFDAQTGLELKFIKELTIRHRAGEPPSGEVEFLYSEASSIIDADMVCGRCKERDSRPPAHTLDQLLSLPIRVLQEDRWRRGIPNYRSSETAAFVGDPLAEAIPELIDFLNYCDQLLMTEHDARRREGIAYAQNAVQHALGVMRGVYRGAFLRGAV